MYKNNTLFLTLGRTKGVGGKVDATLHKVFLSFS